MKVLLCYDRSDYRTIIHRFLSEAGHDVTMAETATDSFRLLVEHGSELDVVIVHKDLGDTHRERITAETVFVALQEYEYIRRIVGSGEYPDGENHVKQLGADGYFTPQLDKGGGEVGTWLLNQVQKGLVSRNEQRRRGRDIEMPRWYPSVTERLTGW